MCIRDRTEEGVTVKTDCKVKLQENGCTMCSNRTLISSNVIDEQSDIYEIKHKLHSQREPQVADITGLPTET